MRQKQKKEEKEKERVYEKNNEFIQEIYPQIFMNETTRIKLEDVIKQLKTSAKSTFHYNKSLSTDSGS